MISWSQRKAVRFGSLMICPVHQLMDGGGTNAARQTKLYQPENSYRMQGGGSTLPATATIGRNPPSGAVVYYSLKSRPTTEVVLEFLDSAGKSVQKFTSPSCAPTNPLLRRWAPHGCHSTGCSDSGSARPRFKRRPTNRRRLREKNRNLLARARQPRVTTDVDMNRLYGT